jgi:hypothetical protein
LTHERPTGIAVVAVVNAVAAALTLAFWALVYVRIFAASASVALERSAAASTLGFLVGDIVWAVPLLIVSVPGLLNLRVYGWLSAQMVNILWMYSMTAIWVRDLYGGQLSPGAILFSVFPAFSLWAAWYLWRHRDRFWRPAGRAS